MTCIVCGRCWCEFEDQHIGDNETTPEACIRLQRERDEARWAADGWYEEAAKVTQQRDEAREDRAYWGQAAHKWRRERDDARQLARDYITVGNSEPLPREEWDCLVKRFPWLKDDTDAAQ